MIALDRKAFFDALRADRRVFGSTLSQAQVTGMNALIDACDELGVTNIHHVAQILAQVYLETGTYMLGIKETVMPHHKDKNPSDATVIRRLDRAFARGQLPWVRKPYWRDGAFGRGPIQVTHWNNYLKIGAALGVDLRNNPNLLIYDPLTGAKSAVVGMARGLFTGKRLSEYVFPQCLDAKPRDHPRRIVNGYDGKDGKVSRKHWAFYDALRAGRFGVVVDGGSLRPATPEETKPLKEPMPSSEDVTTPIKPGDARSLLDQLGDILQRLFG